VNSFDRQFQPKGNNHYIFLSEMFLTAPWSGANFIWAVLFFGQDGQDNEKYEIENILVCIDQKMRLAVHVNETPRSGRFKQ
jgi:hypothetical protein